MENTITIEQSLAGIIGKLGLRKVSDLPTQDMATWMLEALGHIGTTHSLENTEKVIHIENYTGRFPEDLSAPIRIKEGYQMHSIRGGFQVGVTDIDVTLVYQRFITDSRGYPAIPNVPAVAQALTWYVAQFLAIQGILPNKQLSPEYCDDKWQRYCGQARAEGFVPTLDGWERMCNIQRRLLPLENAYANNFAELETRENLQLDPLNDTSLGQNENTI